MEVGILLEDRGVGDSRGRTGPGFGWFGLYFVASMIGTEFGMRSQG
jgi:hypothetical protein